jgi:hypothetical protein
MGTPNLFCNVAHSKIARVPRPHACRSHIIKMGVPHISPLCNLQVHRKCPEKAVFLLAKEKISFPEHLPANPEKKSYLQDVKKYLETE